MLLKHVLLAVALAQSFNAIAYDSIVPPVPREFRAGWVPSVGNSQWPSKRDLSVAEQKSELIAILDRAQALNMNAIILQVRPACDALYASKLEPWSEFLTGQMGKAPSPYYDPLAFAVTEAHKRRIELHAWINPFRARLLNSKSPTSANHVSKKYPGMVLPYGKYLWLDPGQKAVHDYSIAVITDIVRRYDIDGLHMDDYFYPYLEKDEKTKKNIPFPDDASWEKYVAAGGKLSRGDWRRENVNTFVSSTYQSIKAVKPWVKFGVAPFGIWKPGVPPSIKGGNMFEEIYCDSLKWWTNGWVDYMSPQLYWGINPPEQSFTTLSKWWGETNVKKRNLWPGINTLKIGATNFPAGEIIDQIEVMRSIPKGGGHIHWSMKAVMNDKGGIARELKSAYEKPALIPASPWLSPAVPEKPTLTVKKNGNGFKAQWNSSQEKPFLWVVQQQAGNDWKTHIVPGNQNSFTVQNSGNTSALAVSAVNRYGNQSPVAFVDLTK